MSSPPMQPDSSCSTWPSYSGSSSGFSTTARSLMGGQKKDGGSVGPGGPGPHKIERSPVSKAVALMVSRDVLQRER